MEFSYLNIYFTVSEAGVKRKKRKLGAMTSYTGTGSASVSQLLAQREKERSKEATMHPQQVNKSVFIAEFVLHH